MTLRWRARACFVAGLTAALLVPTQAVAEDAHGPGGGGGGETTGSIYADLVVALRAEDGTPVLKKYDVPGDEENEPSTEYCVQPVSYEPVPGVTSRANPLDGRQVWVLPLQGEWIGLPPGDVPVEEIEPCDPQPQYAMFVAEAELERLNLARTSDDVLADKLAAVETKLRTADAITLDGAGRITVDGTSLDASPEFAAMYSSLMRTGTLPGLPAGSAGPPAQVGIFDAWKLAAAAIGTAASKEVPITVDTVEYYNRVIGFPEDDDYVSPWGVLFLRSADPDAPDTQMTSGERFVDFSGFTYNRSQTFRGSVTWLDVPAMKWEVSRIIDVVEFTQLTAEPVGNRTLTGVTAFAQLADDVRATILYYHDHETIPGFYIDPVGVDTTTAQQNAIKDPAVDLGTLPEDVFQTEPFQFTASAFNPWGGTLIEHGRLRVTLDAVDALDPSDVTIESTDGQAVPLTAGAGDLVGWWGPDGGSPMPPGFRSSTTFDVIVADDALVGDLAVRLELVDLDAGTARAEDSAVTHVNDNVATVLWASAPVRLAIQDTPFRVPVTVYSPTAGEAELTFTLTGPGDDPSTDLIEELRAGDAKAYASDGTDMVAMPLTLDEAGRLVGTWDVALSAGYNPVTWYVTVVEGALVGNYAVDVGLSGGNQVDTATIAVAAPEQHGQQPPDAGEDTTPPVVTISVVGQLGTSATFTLSANEDDVTFQVRLVKDDIPGLWEPATEAGKSYTGLTPGIYAFHVKATDAAGNVSGMYSKSWVVSEPPGPGAVTPDTTVVSGPADNEWILSRRATFEVGSTDPAATYVVSTNHQYLGTSETGRIVVRGLRPGSNRITITAVVGGVADPTPVVRTVNVPRGVSGLALSERWNLRQRERHMFGTVAQTRARDEVIRLRSRAISRVVLVVSEGVRNGRVRVFLNGTPLTLRAINLAAPELRTRVLIPIATFASPQQGEITVEVVSAGKLVRVEGIGVASR